MPSVLIREFIPQDVLADKQALLPVFLEIWNAPENLKFLSTTLMPFEPTLVQTWLEHHKDQGGRYFCALDQHDKILGVMVIKASPLDGFDIYGIGVLPEQKSQGVGRMLIQHAVDTAESLGFKSLSALVFADNTAMLCLLITLGFRPVHIEHHKRSDGADAVLLMRHV